MKGKKTEADITIKCKKNNVMNFFLQMHKNGKKLAKILEVISIEQLFGGRKAIV